MKVQSRFIEMFDQAPKVKLGDYITTQSGGTPNTKKTEYYEGGDIPWLSSGEVNQGYITSTEKFITQIGLDNSSAKWTPKDCVVIAMYGATAGKVGFVKIPLTTNQAVCTLLPCDNFKPIFLYYAVSQKTDWMIFKCQGAAQPNISQGIIRSMELPLPSMDEQDKFVSIAEQADKSKFVGFKSRFIEMFGAEDILHTRWPLFRMDEVFTISSSRRILKSEWKDKGSIPFIRVRDMVQLANKEPLTNEFFVSDEFYNSRPDDEKVKPGDIIVSATSTVGKTYIIKPGDRFYFKDADVLLFRKVKEINEVFFTYGLTMPTVWTQIKEGLGGTTVAHFLISNACKLMQPLPPLELQGQFSDIIQQADKSKYYYQIA